MHHACNVQEHVWMMYGRTTQTQTYLVSLTGLVQWARKVRCKTVSGLTFS